MLRSITCDPDLEDYDYDEDVDDRALVDLGRSFECRDKDGENVAVGSAVAAAGYYMSTPNAAHVTLVIAVLLF